MALAMVGVAKKRDLRGSVVTERTFDGGSSMKIILRKGILSNSRNVAIGNHDGALVEATGGIGVGEVEEVGEGVVEAVGLYTTVPSKNKAQRQV